MGKRAESLRGKRSTLTARDMDTASRLVLPRELAIHTRAEGAWFLALSKTASPGKSGRKFQVAAVKKQLKPFGTRIGKGAAVYMTAVLEYITSELLKFSSKACLTESPAPTGALRILRPVHLQQALHGEDFLKLCGGVPPSQWRALGNTPPGNTQSLTLPSTRKTRFSKRGFSAVVRALITQQKSTTKVRTDAMQLLQEAIAVRLRNTATFPFPMN
jgi:histone H3/H4